MTFRLDNHGLLFLSDLPRKKITSFKNKLELIFPKETAYFLGTAGRCFCD